VSPESAGQHEHSSDESDLTSNELERTRRASLWEAAADERERLANERESVADEREWLADERDRQIDRRVHELDRLERLLTEQGVDVGAKLAAVRQAVLRAEPEPGRAAEHLSRIRQEAARAEGRILRQQAQQDRVQAVTSVDSAQTDDERAWLLDRRDFVAAERDRVAEERERLAQRRDDAAEMRESLADKRERDLLRREKELADIPAGTPHVGAVTLTTGADRSAAGNRRAQDRERRIEAARGRQIDASDSELAAAQWRPRAYGQQLTASFSELANNLFKADEPSLALAPVLDFAVAVIPGCDAASLTLWRQGDVFDSLATSASAATLDNIQFVSGEGPAWQAMQDGTPVHVPDAASATRWPALAAAASSLGVAEVLCFGLVVTGERARSALGSFTLVSSSSPSFGVEEREFAAILASYLAVAVAAVQRGEQIERREASLHRALSARDVIGQAKGILMERQGLTAPEAFDVLRRASQDLNLKLGEVAERLVETGQLSADSADAIRQENRPPPTPLV
jgi:hypothetical protein